ncbi:hypothetical protein HZ326_21894 [Fusarium oxysporum f. sp. albedinis]|nr:hypothetical protein HZ326_21894 [Fusarium oxysporum f. sp. albedinis]
MVSSLTCRCDIFSDNDITFATSFPNPRTHCLLGKAINNGIRHLALIHLLDLRFPFQSNMLLASYDRHLSHWMCLKWIEGRAIHNEQQ